MLALLDDPIGRIALFIGAMSGLTLLLVAAAFAAAPRGSSGAAPASPAQKGIGATAARRHQAAGPGSETVAAASADPRHRPRFRLLPRRETLVERLAKTGRGISVGQYMSADQRHRARDSLSLVIFARFRLIASLCRAPRSGCSFRITSSAGWAGDGSRGSSRCSRRRST